MRHPETTQHRQVDERPVSPAVAGSEREVLLPRSIEPSAIADAADPTKLYSDARVVLGRYVDELHREIAAIERERQRVTVAALCWEPRIGPASGKPECAASAAPLHDYTVVLGTPWRGRIGDRTVVRVAHPNQPVSDLRGELRERSQDGKTLRVQVRGALPNPDSRAVVELTVDDAWLERELLRCVQAVVDNPQRVGPERLSRALRACGWTRHTIEALDSWTPPAPRSLVTLAAHPWLARLNEGQLRAVRGACGSGDVHQVNGPPGTGKTYVTGAIVMQLLQQNERILVLAPSNGAADLVTSSVIEWCVRDPERAGLVGRGLVQRWGPGAAAGPHAALTEERVIARLAAERAAYLRDPGTWSGDRRVRRAEALAAESNSIEQVAAWLACPLPESVARERLEEELRKDAGRFRRAAEQAVKRECQVVVATTAAPLCLGRQLRKYAPAALLVDESSMVGLATSFLGALNARRVVHIGDPRQLGPVIKARRTPLLASSALCGASGERQRRRGEISELREQHRMAEPICDLVNAAFPDGVVMETAQERRDVPRPQWQRHGSIVLVDTTALRPVSLRPHDGGSVETAVHAAVAASMWRAIRRAGDAGAGPRVAIISPYLAQCDALGRHGVCAVDVSTIHARQGDAADVVILSLDECSPQTMHFLGAGRAGELEGEKMLYVGATRARHTLAVVAPVEFLLRHGSRATRSFLARVVEVAEHVSPDQFYAP